MVSAPSLFQATLEERLRERGPLAARMRPESLSEMVGQEHLLGPGRPLRALIDSDRLSSVVLWGPPGSGKTTLAHLIAKATRRAFVGMSAVSAGVKDVREVVEEARRRLGEEGKGTILFLDEVHRFNRAQQDALLPSVESGELTLVGATTENPFFSVNPPLLSRSTLFRLEPLSTEAILVLLRRALEHEGATASEEALARLASLVEGDARGALTSLEVAMALAAARHSSEVTVADVEAARGARALRYGVDEHYDVASAFIKSIRGSDPDAGLYWLARMLEGGEDARFIARRLVILASEDVGMADPVGLLVADAAARAVEVVGLPEAQLNLAHATVYLANAPKSNSVTAALERARRDAVPGGADQGIAGGASSADDQRVPVHLRDAHYLGAARLGHGEGYVYPHAEPGGWVAQQYRPAHLEGHVYWEPTGRGQDVRRRAGGG
ncbi:MAG: replication-associated recombination protein A [Acidimicrobiales bacterium]